MPLSPLPPTFAAPAEPAGDYLLQMAKVDYFIRQRQFAKATEELGRISKDQQADPLFQRYADRATRGLYGPTNRPGPRSALSKPPKIARNRLRVTRHRKDADRNSDQSSDPDGWHVSEHMDADVEGKSGVRGKFVVDVEGSKGGHNDVRYRTLLADFYRDDNHFAMGDSASYPSPYFLRGSRLRGLNVVLPGDRHQFQGVVGAYPVWMESRDEYIYPRSVVGARDKWILFDERVQLAGGVIQTRDSNRIRAEDGANPGARTGVANSIRDNLVFSLDQEIKMIPEVWYLKASEAWSQTDEDLNDNRFGDSTKLKDHAMTIQSLLVQPWGQWISLYQKTGPDFELLTDLPQGAVNNPKTFSKDRQLVEQSIDFKPIGIFDLDVEASWQRNNLDEREDVEQTRQSWYTADLGILVPQGMPRPRIRASMIDTVSVPGPVNHPDQTRVYMVHPEVSHFIGGWHVTGFADYQTEIPTEDKETVSSAEQRWAVGTRLATSLSDRFTLSPHYTYRVSDENLDLNPDQLSIKTMQHEAGVSTSYRLWGTSSLGLSYDYLRGKLPGYGTSVLPVHTEGHSGTASFTWPYTRSIRANRRKISIFPGLVFHLTDLDHDMGRRPLLTGRLSLAYEAFKDWKLELMGEHRYDKNVDTNDVRTGESRFWLLWKSEWKEGGTQSIFQPVEDREVRRFETDLQLRNGYRQDDFRWSIAGDTAGQNPNVLSELSWEDLRIYQVGGTARFTARPFLSGRVTGNYGWIFDGEVRDSDYAGNNRLGEFSRSDSSSDDGSVWDVSAGIGWPWEPPSGELEFRLTPLAGYAYRRQNLTLTEGSQTIPPTGSFSGLDSEYETQWWGPWVGADVEVKPVSRVRLFGTFEYHWADYKAAARWNLRTDLSQPKSFRHLASGKGLIGSVGMGYLLTRNWTIELQADYQHWKAENGFHHMFFADSTTADSKLNDVELDSFAVSLGTRARY